MDNVARDLSKEKQTGRMPTSIVKDAHVSLSDSQKHCKNYAGKPATLNTAKNAKRKAKKLLLKSYGLSVQRNTLSNVYVAGHSVQKKDVFLRRKIGDKSDQYRGMLRNMSISAGDDDIEPKDSLSVNITLFNRTQIMIFHHVAETGRMTIHLDGTKFQADLGIELEDGHTILHHILSINGNAFVVGSDPKEIV